MQFRLTALVCLGLFVACDKGEDAESKPDAAPKEAKKGDGEDEADDEKAPADEAAEAGEDEAADAEAAPSNAECPEALRGKHEGDIVITKDCGAVPVSGNYRVDGGSLTLEAGATLEFEDGAELSVGYYDSAKLIVRGTKDAPVTMTSKGDDAAGVWKGVRLFSKAARSTVTGLVLEYAGDDKYGGLHVDAPDVELTESTVAHCKGAGVIAGKNAKFAAFADNTFTDVGKIAIRAPAHVVSGLGIGNTYGDAQRILVTGGTINDEAHWLTQAAPVQIGGKIKVDGKDGVRAKLTLDPGTRLEFGGSSELVIGYYGEASIEARGSEAKPIVFASADREEPGAYGGVIVSSKGEGHFEHVQFHHGGKDDKAGVLHAEGEAHVSIEHATFESNEHGVVLAGKNVSLDAFSNNTFKATPAAVRVHAAVMGGLGEGNSYDEGSSVTIDAGTVEEDAKWAVQPGAKILMDGKLQVSGGRLELPAGFELAFKDGAEMVVGYYDTAALVVSGTAEAPVVFAGQRDEAGAWGGVKLSSKSSGNDIEYLTIRHAAEPAVELNKSAAGSIKGLTCESCAGAAIEKPDGSSFEVEQ